MPLTTPKIDGSSYEYDRYPPKCPICHVAVLPTPVVGLINEQLLFQTSTLELVFKCPRLECSHFFIGRYQRPGIRATGLFFYHRAVPETPARQTISGEVEGISPHFCEIFNQASAADSMELPQVAGVGYRKALEFLVKDYCISLRPDDADQIKAKPLAACIREYVTNTEVKVCAERAAWIGNDETHYVRKWEDKDITDLKRLIHLTVNWIDSAIVTQKYLSEMP